MRAFFAGCLLSFAVFAAHAAYAVDEVEKPHPPPPAAHCNQWQITTWSMGQMKAGGPGTDPYRRLTPPGWEPFSAGTVSSAMSVSGMLVAMRRCVDGL